MITSVTFQGLEGFSFYSILEIFIDFTDFVHKIIDLSFFLFEALY